MRKKIEWQSMEVPYPEKVFLVMMFLGKEKAEIILPLDMVYETAKQGILALERNQKTIENFKEKRKIIGAIIIEMKLKKEIELKKEHWAVPKDKEMWRYRFLSYSKFLDKPKLYQYLVVPRFFDDKSQEWQLSASIPFYISDESSVIEKYFPMSNESVDQRAKSAATYTAEKMWGMNWKTREIKEIEEKLMSGVLEEVEN